LIFSISQLFIPVHFCAYDRVSSNLISPMLNRVEGYEPTRWLVN